VRGIVKEARINSLTWPFHLKDRLAVLSDRRQTALT